MRTGKVRLGKPYYFYCTAIIHFFKNVFMGTMSNFYKYNKSKSSQILHIGSLNL